MGRIGWADKIKGKTWGLTLFAVVREMFGFLSHFFFPFSPILNVSPLNPYYSKGQ